MGAKTWMLVASDGSAKEVLCRVPELDEKTTASLVGSLFPSEKVVPIGTADLTYICPPDDEIIAGCFGRVSLVAAKEFAPDRPSQLPRKFIEALQRDLVVLHAMHSVVDWFAFAVWEKGELKRALSVAPDSGIVEDLGERLEFEEPFWGGAHPAVEPGDDEDYPLPFHPLEFGEAALENFFGYQIEGFLETTHPAPESVRLMRFRRQARPWWKLW